LDLFSTLQIETHFFIVSCFSGGVFWSFFHFSPDFSVFGGSGEFRGVRFLGSGGSEIGVEKTSEKTEKRVNLVKKGGLSIVTHFYIVRRFSGGVFLGWGSFGVWGKRGFSGFSHFFDPFLETPETPGPPNFTQPPETNPPLHVYIYI